MSEQLQLAKRCAIRLPSIQPFSFMSTNILFASFSRSAALRFLQAHDLVTQYVTEMAKLKPTSSMLPAPTCTTHSTASLNSDKTVTNPDDDLSDDCICEIEYRTCAQCVGLLLRASTKETVVWRRLSTNVLLLQALELCVACSAEEVLRMHLLSSGALVILAQVLTSKEGKTTGDAFVVVQPVLRAICHLAPSIDPGLHAEVPDIVSGLSSFLSDSTPLSLRELAVSALGGLASGTHPSVHDLILRAHGAVSNLLSSVRLLRVNQKLGESALLALHKLACRDERGAGAVCNAGGCGVLVKLITDPSTHPLLSESITEDVLDVIASMIDLRLGQIAVVRAENAIQYFIAAVLRQTSDRQKHAAGWVLVNLAHDPELGTYAVEKGILVGLTAYSASRDEKQQEEAAWALANLSSQKLNADKMSDAPVLSALVSLLKGATTSHNESNCPMKPKVCMQAIWALANLAVHQSLKRRIAEHGAITELIRHLQFWLDPPTGALNPEEDDIDEVIQLLRRQAMRALANLAAEHTNRAQIADAVGLPTIIRAGWHRDAALQEVTARTLASMTCETNLAQSFVNLGGVSMVEGAFLRCGSSSRVQEEALLIVHNLSLRQSQALICDTILGALVAKIMDLEATATTQERTARALRNLCEGSIPNKMAVMRNGALRALNQLASATCVKASVREEARATITELSSVLTPTSRRALVQAIMMPPTSKDVEETRSTLRGAGCGPSKKHSPQRPSPLATMRSVVERR